jgi:hypothetical protein
MNKKLRQPRGPARANLTINPLAEIEDTRPYYEPPTLISKAMLGGIEGESWNMIRKCRIADETTSRMRVQTDHEKERKMMGIPEGFKTLIAYLVVGSCVHQEHDKQHEMASNATGLGIVDLKRNLWPNL